MKKYRVEIGSTFEEWESGICTSSKKGRGFSFEVDAENDTEATRKAEENLAEIKKKQPIPLMDEDVPELSITKILQIN